ncbi:MAG TPA: hypothetical protein VHL11_03560, partial [Phototrophicaceae bacterium]|nr:hypothetical protein [Phototrophicaceae bacterium]
TFYVDLYTGVYNEMGASAGHGYLNGMMPVVLIGQHTDGTFIAYSGCYVMGFKLDGTAGIVSGKLTKLVDGIPSGTDILTALNIDCTALGLSY